MKYKEFKNISIVNASGVSKVGKDTLALARCAGQLFGGKVLDMGTGTGFVAIYLAKLGKQVDASDISLTSVLLVKKMVRINKVNVKAFQSDLFQNVRKKYTIITFNPPIGTSSSPQLAVLIEKIKSFFPKSDFLSHVALMFLGNQRKSIIKKFLSDAKQVLDTNGEIAIILTSDEKALLKSFNYSYSFFNENGVSIAILKKK